MRPCSLYALAARAGARYSTGWERNSNRSRERKVAHMKKHIGKTLRTVLPAATLFLLAWALPCAAPAFQSDYTSISVPGAFDSGAQWDTGTHQLALVADYVWQGVLAVTKAGQFKFAANGGWDVNWGMVQTIQSVPAENLGPLARGGSNISLALAPGSYRFVFFEDTSTFSILAVQEAPSAVKLVGNFNDEGALDAGTMVSLGNDVWKTTLDLDSGSTFRVQADDRLLGARSPVSLASMPASVALFGTAEAAIGTLGGTFEFTMDFRSNLLSVVQTATNAFTLSCVGADGTFACGGKTPGQNLEDVGDNVWQGSFMLEKDNFSLRFVGRDDQDRIGRWWGFPAGTVITELPASGTLSATNTDYATFTTGAGDYVFRINPYSGSWTVRRHDRANLLENPSFESLNEDGTPAGWGLYHAAGGDSDTFDAHSGVHCALLQRLYDDWDNLGNIDQRVRVPNAEGLPFQVAASFRCADAWHGDMVRIIVEWLDSSGAMINEEYTEVLNLDRHWQTAVLDTTVPASNVTAHILFKYDGAQLGETVLIDDVFAGIAASREQNFDAWGRHDDFGPLDPDWSVTSGKTVPNAASARVLGGLVISRYIESTGNTKAIELYNGTASNINLKTTPYYLQQYNNGSTDPSVTIALTNGSIPAGRTYAVTRTFPTGSKYPPDSALRQFGAIGGLSSRILRTDKLTFNGDDVIVLRRGTSSGRIVDRVGQAGANASGSLWSRMATDHTLVRNSTVTNGNTSSATSAFDLSEWTVLENGDFGDLGTHAFTDPDAPFVPSGYSLILNTDAILSTPALDGGIGDISFWARAQGAATGADLKLAVESAPDPFSDAWSLETVFDIPVSQTNFARFECVAANTANTVVRFRHVGDGTTNRVRIDDISIGRAYTVKRTENFAAWTGDYSKPGTYTLAQWTLCGTVADNGVAGTLAGNLPVDSGWVRSPTFSGGVGQVAFALCRATTNDTVQATLQASGDDGITWTDIQTFSYGTGGKLSTNVSAWVYIPSNGCARIVCDGGSADAIVDNISVGIPSVSRTLDFNDFAVNSNYKSYGYKGWNLTELAIVSSNAWSGHSGLLRNGTLSSPRIDPIGSISFVYRMGPYSGDNTAKLKLEVSSDGSSWTVVTNGLQGTAEWQNYGYWFAEGTDWHYVRISQTVSGKRMLLDDISINAPAPVPTVALTSFLNPAYPAVKEAFQIAATAYPRNGADILSVTGFVKYTKSGRFTPLSMEDAGAGDYLSPVQTGRNGGESIISYATVWYGGVGAVPGNPGYAVTNLSTPATTVTVSSVRSGEVWINELSYARFVPPDDETDPYKDDEDFGDWLSGWNQDHEFVEICGKAGTDIGRWKIQFAYALSGDIAVHSNQAVYATYTIPAGTILTNRGDGFGFWLLADSDVTGGDQVLDTLDPLDADGFGELTHSHIHDSAGVIRLVNQYGGVMQSISYGAYADSAERLPVTQAAADNNVNTIALAGTGGLYADFVANPSPTNGWTMAEATPGGVNAGQTLDDTVIVNLMAIWHDPDVRVTTTKQGTFYLLDPRQASQSEAVRICFAYTNSTFPSYASLDGKLYYRLQGATEWKTEEKNSDFDGNDSPDSDEAYFAFKTIPAYTYKRLQTIEYVIEATAPGFATTYLGVGADDSPCQAYETFLEAQANPFTHYYPLADPIVITNFVIDAAANTLTLETDGNDSQDRLTEFKIRSTTDLRLPTGDWDEITDFEHDGDLEWDTFTIDLPDGPARHFAVQPLR